MKAVILAGGYGSRISEESHLRPKPMVEIGGKPLLWHILKLYSAQGICDFVICCGYKSYVIKEYFSNYFLHMADVTFDMVENSMEVHQRNAEPWRVTLIDTGTDTMTAGRLKRVRSYLDERTFCMTYGDGVSDVDLRRLIGFHESQKTYATVTAVHPAARFGVLDIVDDRVTAFEEKPKGEGGWINGGFFVLEPAVFDYIDGDGTIWEREPLERLARDRQLATYRHTGFWSSVDTLRDKNHLEDLWASGRAPWKVW
ncbi:MAG TPA: glucose-1-phosphate cytidylyltransferase [Casimicrobiaceae bacterium]|nr:glucose-1-phosphate cytidylyltransferase [Casimicrobiaceae bacterium]